MKSIKRIGQCIVSAVLITSLVVSTSPVAEAKKVSKKESVYVNAGVDGTVSKVTVSDWLKGSKQMTGVLKDQSNLNNISNVKGDETFTQKGQDLEWNTKGEDIYYQGETTEELPIDMKISFKLDDVETDAKDMLGKSGKVQIHVEYTNKSKQTKRINGEDVTIYTPFVMLTGMILPSDVYENIEIDHGRVINDGSNNIVIGLGVPGLKESLDLKEDEAEKIPDEFTITADVKDFSLGNTFTFASPNLFNELELKDMDELDELEEKLDDLNDAAEELVEGSQNLSDNMELFADKMGELKNSVKKFKKNGVDKLADGIGTLAKGAPELAKGVKEYTSGVTKFANGTTAYVDGAKQITDGCNTLYAKVENLPQQMNTFSAGLKTYTNGVDQLGAKENVTKMKNGAKAVSDGITSLHNNLATLEQTYESTGKLVQGLKATGADASMIAQLEAVLAGQKQAVEQLKAATSDAGELKQGAGTLAGGVNAVMDGLGQLSASSSQLTTGASTMAKGMPELVAGVKQLKTGGDKLSANNEALKKSSKKLVKASSKLNKSVKQVKKGVNTLNKGSKSLKKATNKLVTGVDKLSVAGDKLDNGSCQLAEGMSDFNKKGVKKIVNTYDNTLVTMLDRMKAIRKAGKNYKSFSGSSDYMDGEVKFIIETENMEKEDK